MLRHVNEPLFAIDPVLDGLCAIFEYVSSNPTPLHNASSVDVLAYDCELIGTVDDSWHISFTLGIALNWMAIPSLSS
jgi:hypothetical protein